MIDYQLNTAWHHRRVRTSTALQQKYEILTVQILFNGVFFFSLVRFFRCWHQPWRYWGGAVWTLPWPYSCSHSCFISLTCGLSTKWWHHLPVHIHSSPTVYVIAPKHGVWDWNQNWHSWKHGQNVRVWNLLQTVIWLELYKPHIFCRYSYCSYIDSPGISMFTNWYRHFEYGITLTAETRNQDFTVVWCCMGFCYNTWWCSYWHVVACLGVMLTDRSCLQLY